MQHSCLQRISPWLFGAHTSETWAHLPEQHKKVMRHVGTAQLLPRCSQRRGGRRIWADYASRSWELGLITLSIRGARLNCGSKGQVISSFIMHKLLLPKCHIVQLVYFFPIGSLPITAAQRKLPSRPRAAQGDVHAAPVCLKAISSLHKNHTHNQIQQLLTPGGCSQGLLSFHSHHSCGFLLISLHKAPRPLLAQCSLAPQNHCDATQTTRACLGTRSRIITSVQTCTQINCKFTCSFDKTIHMGCSHGKETQVFGCLLFQPHLAGKEGRVLALV